MAEPLWEKEFKQCPYCGSEERVSTIAKDGLKKGKIDFIIGPEIIPLERTQLVVPHRVLIRYQDQCNGCGAPYFTKVFTTIGMEGDPAEIERMTQQMKKEGP